MSLRSNAAVYSCSQRCARKQRAIMNDKRLRAVSSDKRAAAREAPWSAVETLFEALAGPLPESAPPYLYGSYRRGGAHKPRRAMRRSTRAFALATPPAACVVLEAAAGVAHGIRKSSDRANAGHSSPQLGSSVSAQPSRWNPTAPSALRVSVSEAQSSHLERDHATS